MKDANILSFDEVKAHGALGAHASSSRRGNHAAVHSAPDRFSSPYRSSISSAYDAVSGGDRSKSQSWREFSASDIQSDDLRFAHSSERANTSHKASSRSDRESLLTKEQAHAKSQGFSQRKEASDRGSTRGTTRGNKHARTAHTSRDFHSEDISSRSSRRASGQSSRSSRPRHASRTTGVSNRTKSKDRSSEASGREVCLNHSDTQSDARRSERSSNTSRFCKPSSASRDARTTPASQKSERDRMFKRIRKQHRSKKVDREFFKVVGTHGKASQERDSRAACYEMHMGSVHKKSVCMQNQTAQSKSKDSKQGVHLPFSMDASKVLPSPVITRGIALVAAAVFSVFLLYPSCQTYYKEIRELQQLQAEYEALESYNSEMQAQIDYLNTDEGIEEYARSELGWIREDEQIVTVEGVESSSDGAAKTTAAYELNVVVSAPETWYSGVLDVIFGYSS